MFFFKFLTNHEVKIGETYDDTSIIDTRATENSLILWGFFLASEKEPFLIGDSLWVEYELIKPLCEDITHHQLWDASQAPSFFNAG